MAEIRVNATGGLKLYDADDSHYAQIVAGTITSNVDAITLGHNIATFNAAVTAGGVLKTDDATEATSTTDGSLQTDGGLSVVKDAVFGDDVKLLSDSSVIAFGADGDTTLTHTDGTGLTLNSTNKICFNDASQFIQGSSNAILALGATDEIDLTATAVDLNGTLDVSGTGTVNGVFEAKGGAIFNEGSADVDFRVETNGLTHAIFADGGNDRIGFGTVPSLGLVHIQSSDVGGDVSIHADELVLENNNNCGITILAKADSASTIYFGDDGDNDIGKLTYDHGVNDMIFTANTTEGLRIQDTGQITTGGETAADVSAGGLCLDQNALDTLIMTFKSSDVAQGTTNLGQETDDFAFFKKSSATEGGLEMCGLSEGAVGLRLRGFADDAPSGKATSDGGCVEVQAMQISGTGTVAHSANGNLMCVKNDGTTRFIFDADGDFHADSSSTTFDAYDDAQLARAFDLSKGKGVVDSKFDKFVAYNHEHLADLQLVGREKDGTPNHFINVCGMQRLHNGAIWQQYEKHNQLLEAVYDLAKEAVGEEKANAILDKHEVKRLQ